MGWSRFLRRRHWDAERARELESHLAHEYDDNLARGMPPGEARRAARIKLGNPTLVREEIYQMNTIAFIDSVWKDLSYGLRLLGRTPAFAAVAVLTLALGTGANTAIFQIIDAVRLRVLPVSSPHELVSVGIDTHDRGRTGTFLSRRPFMTEPLWQRIQAEQQSFSSMLAWAAYRFDLATEGESRPVDGLWVNGGFFETLGVRAAVGRVFSPGDDMRGCGSPGVVLSHGFWQRRFAGDPGVVGRSLSLDRQTFEILGVTPASFFGVEVGRTFDVAAPICAEPLVRAEESGLGRQDYWFLDVMGRLKPGWTIERTSAHLAAISPQIFRDTVSSRYNTETAREYLDFTLTASGAATGVSSLRRTYENPLWLLLGLTALVLLIACANLANLMLARATAREREIGVRLAIGASRIRVLRQILTESLLIAALGAAGGVVLANWLSGTLVSLLSTERSPIFVGLAMDWRTFGFAAALAVFACLLFGLAPAVTATGAHPSVAAQGAGRSTTDRRERVAFRRALLVLQVALSLVLITGALLFANTLRNLRAVDPGFRQSGILIASLDLRAANVPARARGQFYADIVERVRGIPGVHSAAEAAVIPLSGAGWNNHVLIDGAEKPGLVNMNAVGPSYFAALGTTVLAGREFDRTDGPSSQPVCVVNQSFARKYFPDRDPIAQTLQVAARAGEPRPIFRVVGVVADTKYLDLREPFPPIVYFVAAQQDEPDPSLALVIRSDAPPAALAGSITRTVAALAPAATIQYDTMLAQIRNLLISERLMATLSGFFGALAVVIAMLGLYGVISYLVSRRQREIGVRLALGAESSAIVRMVVREAALLLAAGLGIGALLVVFCARYARSMLYGLTPSDPPTIGFAVLALGVTALVASWIPARRASHLDPAVVLRQDQG